MRNVLFILLFLLIVGCEDEKVGLRGKVMIEDYSIYKNEINIDYRVINTGSEDIFGWIISFTAVMNNGVQYTLNDSVQKSRGWDYYLQGYFYGYTPGDTSDGFSASTPTPYEGVNSVSVKSVVFKAEDE